jgi:alpha-tubulin suppressor-like RCC1 family protein
VRCWGQGYFGQNGNASPASIGDDELPSSAGDVDVGAPVELLTVGGDHACVVLGGSRVRCWGRGEEGQLGYGNPNSIGDNETPASAGFVEYF